MSMAIYMVACIAIFIPTVSAGGFYCNFCVKNPLQSPSQCNMSVTSKSCGGSSSDSECFAVTAELNNGSIISLKECYIKRNVQDICVNTTACNRAENMTGVSPFKRCEAKCCSTDNCNKYLVPDMIPVHSPTQSGPASTSIAPTAANSTTKASTTEVPASGGTNIEAFCFLSVLLLFGIQMAI